MASTQVKSMLNDANEFAQEIIRKSRSDVQPKLTAVNAACQSILENGGRISLNGICGWIASNSSGIKVGYKSLVNKYPDQKTGQNEFSSARKIFDKYDAVQKVKLASLKREVRQESFATPDLDEEEIRQIKDHQVRYKVQLLSARVRNLNNQLNAAREIGKLPMVPLSMLSANLPFSESNETLIAASYNSNLTLSEPEVDALADFMNPKSLRRRNLDFDAQGILNIETPPNRNREISQISRGFFDQALQKILKSYNRI